MNSQSAPKKRKHDQRRSRGHVHPNTTTENPSINKPSPASQEGKFEGLHASRPHILNLFAQVSHLATIIDKAFEGQPFLPHLRPDAPANTRRFSVYLEQHRQVFKLFAKALEFWMISYGLKPGENWIPLLVEEMKQKGLQQDRQTTSPQASRQP
jgi:hypothetical protein